MRIAILSQSPELYSTRRLLESGRRRGHHVELIDFMQCYMNITAHDPTVIYEGRKLQNFDAIIPRIGPKATFYGTAVVRQFEIMGVFAANGSQAITRSRDKLRCLQTLAKEGIALPITGFAHATKQVQDLVAMVGGPPLVIKLLEGTQGIGVVLAETEKAAESVIEAFRNLDAHILVQECIQESLGHDIRAFVVGGRVVAAMRRVAQPGEFRANIHRGGIAEKIQLTQEERRVAQRATKAVGLHIAGVDMLRSKDGPLVIEINSSPGLEGIEQASGVDVGGKIIEFLERRAQGRPRRDRVAV